jgi:3' exoribonuclease, RNase T-like
VKLFFDFEFTGLHKDTTPISLGIVAANGNKFYAEFNDYDYDQVDDWIQENVIDNLLFNENQKFYRITSGVRLFKGDKEFIREMLLGWLSSFKHAEFWGDTLSYDGVLLNDLLGNGSALNIPDNVDYIFYDIATLFKMFDIDPDINREAFIDRPIVGEKHNSLYDAAVIEACYEKLYRNQERYSIKF